MPWRELYWHRNFFFDKVSHLKHPTGHQPFSFSICFWSSNFVFDQDLRNFKLGQNNYNFVAQNYKYSSTGCMVSWLAVSLEMDAPKNLGFGNISAPLKRLKCFRLVGWTKLCVWGGGFHETNDYCKCRHHTHGCRSCIKKELILHGIFFIFVHKNVYRIEFQ